MKDLSSLHSWLQAFTTLTGLIGGILVVQPWFRGGSGGPKWVAVARPVLLVLCLVGATALLRLTDPRESARSHYETALKHFAEQNRPRAIAEALTATRMEPTFADGFKLLGACYGIDQRNAEAVRAYRTAHQLNPEDPEATWGLAQALDRGGEREAALATYRQLTRNPGANQEQLSDAQTRIAVLER